MGQRGLVEHHGQPAVPGSHWRRSEPAAVWSRSQRSSRGGEQHVDQLRHGVSEVNVRLRARSPGPHHAMPLSASVPTDHAVAWANRPGPGPQGWGGGISRRPLSDVKAGGGAPLTTLGLVTIGPPLGGPASAMSSTTQEAPCQPSSVRRRDSHCCARIMSTSFTGPLTRDPRWSHPKAAGSRRRNPCEGSGSRRAGLRARAGPSHLVVERSGHGVTSQPSLPRHRGPGRPRP